MEKLQRKDWVVDVGATPQKYRDSGDRRMSLGYVGKYVAGTAIGDGRIETIDVDQVTFRAFDYRSGETILLEFSGGRFIDAYSDHTLPHKLRRFRLAGIFAAAGRQRRLETCRQLLGEPSAEHLAAAADDSLNPFAGDADEVEPEEEGSFVPCPECGWKTSLRQALDGPLVRELLEVVSAVLWLLRGGAKLTILTAIEIVALAQADHRGVYRTLLPGRLETNEALILFTETVIRDRLREQQQRGPPEATMG
jgi:hypothetical protein